MSIWDWGKKAVTDVAGAARDSGIPGVSTAAGLGLKVFGGGGDEAEAPGYTPYEYNAEAFQPGVSNQFDENVLRSAQNDLSTQRWGRENEGLYAEALNQQRDTMLGNRPSIAEMQMQRQVQANNAQQMAAAGSARGAGSTMLAQMNAMQQVGGNNRDAAYQGAMLRAQEQDAARQGMFGAISQDRAAAISGNKARIEGLAGMSNSLLNRDQYKSGLATGLEDRRAAQNAAVQGRALDNYSNQQSAEAYAEDARAKQNAGMMQAGVGAAGAAGMFGGKK